MLDTANERSRKKLHEKGTTNKERNKHTARLLDQLGPEGRVGEKLYSLCQHRNCKTKLRRQKTLELCWHQMVWDYPFVNYSRMPKKGSSLAQEIRGFQISNGYICHVCFQCWWLALAEQKTISKTRITSSFNPGLPEGHINLVPTII